VVLDGQAKVFRSHGHTKSTQWLDFALSFQLSPESILFN